MIDTSDIREVEAYGAGDIAETLFLTDASGARLACTLCYLRVHWASGSGTATLKVSVDDERGSDFDVDLYARAARGNGADLNLINNNLPGWRIRAASAYKVSWTDPGTATWSIVVGLKQVKA